jgi:hypothetical protein
MLSVDITDAPRSSPLWPALLACQLAIVSFRPGGSVRVAVAATSVLGDEHARCHQDALERGRLQALARPR